MVYPQFDLFTCTSVLSAILLYQMVRTLNQFSETVRYSPDYTKRLVYVVDIKNHASLILVRLLGAISGKHMLEVAAWLGVAAWEPVPSSELRDTHRNWIIDDLRLKIQACADNKDFAEILQQALDSMLAGGLASPPEKKADNGPLETEKPPLDIPMPQPPRIPTPPPKKSKRTRRSRSKSSTHSVESTSSLASEPKGEIAAVVQRTPRVSESEQLVEPVGKLSRSSSSDGHLDEPTGMFLPASNGESACGKQQAPWKTVGRKRPTKPVVPLHRGNTLLNASSGNQPGVSSATRMHVGKGFDGTMYGVSWRAAERGNIIYNRVAYCQHVTNGYKEEHHAFPDFGTDEIPETVAIGDVLEVPTPDGPAEVLVDGLTLVWHRMGRRTLWAIVPSFFCSESLVPGTPIFRGGKLVSVVTKSDGLGNYAVSGVGRPSGHTIIGDFRVVKAAPGCSVYGNLVAPYSVIKAEAMRPKQFSTITTGAQVILFPSGRVDYTEWGADNLELMHVRMDGRESITVCEF